MVLKQMQWMDLEVGDIIVYKKEKWRIIKVEKEDGELFIKLKNNKHKCFKRSFYVCETDGQVNKNYPSKHYKLIKVAEWKPNTE